MIPERVCFSIALLEGKLGDIHKQNGAFYATNAALFVVFAHPGFVYRYLWRRRGG
jgi:hypothetical protein